MQQATSVPSAWDDAEKWRRRDTRSEHAERLPLVRRQAPHHGIGGSLAALIASEDGR